MLTSMLWQKVKQWCKERWELIAGFFAGIVAILLIFRRDNTGKILEKKGELQDDLSDSEAKAREELEEEWNSNIEQFLERNTKIEEDHKKKLLEVDDDKKGRVKELMSSDQPEEDIAKALGELLK